MTPREHAMRVAATLGWTTSRASDRVKIDTIEHEVSDAVTEATHIEVSGVSLEVTKLYLEIEKLQERVQRLEEVRLEELATLKCLWHGPRQPHPKKKK
jgi:hypothetical protein